MKTLTKQIFEQLKNDTLTLRNEEVSFQCTIAEINDLKAYEGQQYQPFSIVLNSADKTPHPQAIYELEHDSLEDAAIFIVPIGLEESGMQYEAIFN